MFFSANMSCAATWGTKTQIFVVIKPGGEGGPILDGGAIKKTLSANCKILILVEDGEKIISLKSSKRKSLFSEGS